MAARAGRRTAAAFLLLLLAAMLAACAPLRTVEAIRLLEDVARAEPRDDVVRRVVRYGPEEARHGHLYGGADARAALVLVPGAAAEALDDPRLVGFASAMSRRRLLVLVPALGESLALSAADADAVAAAVAYLRDRHGADEVGLAALSYAAGPALLAALREDTGPHVRYIVAIGPYHDIVESIAFLTTGAFREAPAAPWRRAPVDAAAKWVFLEANAARVRDPADAARLAAIARGRLAGRDTRGNERRLGAEGRRVLALFVNTDPDRVPALVAALPPALRGEIEALDLARADLSRLRAELILVHGRTDRLVPYTESIRLAASVPRARLHLLDALDHVDLRAPGLGDSLALLSVARRVLAERDRGPAPGGAAAGGLQNR